jgi:diguanylate cyclase (GGDEF)-like protein
MNHTPAAQHYLYLAVLVTVYVNINQRLGYKFAIAASALNAGIFTAFVLGSGVPLAAKVVGISLMIAAGYLSLMAKMRMERDVRYNFLVQLRERVLRDQAEDHANNDSLTGLRSRHYLSNAAADLWKRAAAAPLDVALIMLDVDHFKVYNDTFGHPEGDRCLARVASALRAELRNTQDLAVRYGGEEFLVLLPNATLGQAQALAERVRRRIAALEIPHARSIGTTVTASMGVVSATVPTISLDDLISGADTALYAAKNAGRNRVWPTPAPSASHDTRLPLVS